MINQELIYSARERDYEVSDDLRKYILLLEFLFFSHILKQLSKQPQLYKSSTVRLNVKVRHVLFCALWAPMAATGGWIP